ncbi:MAG: DUF1697 domain-containing protein [Planctomycetia bacterium]|nr:DUF1697 domain-containing protein [Planctomycetia bacterium]
MNVGGKHLIAMADVVKAFERAGATDVSTYLQSGNVRFRATPSDVTSIAAAASAALTHRCAAPVPVVVRSVEALRRVLAANPFAGRDPDGAAMHVAFLAEVPDRARVASLDPARSPGDAFVVVDGDVYLHLPNGVARTKLTNAWLDRTLATVSTLRNVRTVRALAADAPASPGP